MCEGISFRELRLGIEATQSAQLRLNEPKRVEAGRADRADPVSRLERAALVGSAW